MGHRKASEAGLLAQPFGTLNPVYVTRLGLSHTRLLATAHLHGIDGDTAHVASKPHRKKRCSGRVGQNTAFSSQWGDQDPWLDAGNSSAKNV